MAKINKSSSVSVESEDPLLVLITFISEKGLFTVPFDEGREYKSLIGIKA